MCTPSLEWQGSHVQWEGSATRNKTLSDSERVRRNQHQSGQWIKARHERKQGNGHTATEASMSQNQSEDSLCENLFFYISCYTSNQWLHFWQPPRSTARAMPGRSWHHQERSSFSLSQPYWQETEQNTAISQDQGTCESSRGYSCSKTTAQL